MTSSWEAVADALLYEGYLLYPYRPSALKNRQRWTYGGVYPRAYSEASGGTDAWQMRTECLVAAGLRTALSVRVRFLQLLQRRIGDPSHPAWQEATERQIRAADLAAADLLAGALRVPFAFPASGEMHEHEGVEGEVEV